MIHIKTKCMLHIYIVIFWWLASDRHGLSHAGEATTNWYTSWTTKEENKSFLNHLIRRSAQGQNEEHVVHLHCSLSWWYQIKKLFFLYKLYLFNEDYTRLKITRCSPQETSGQSLWSRAIQRGTKRSMSVRNLYWTKSKYLATFSWGHGVLKVKDNIAQQPFFPYGIGVRQRDIGWAVLDKWLFHNFFMRPHSAQSQNE